jgi:O-antigen ligase
MQRALGWFRNNPLSPLFFLLLFPGIFLGDGKQTAVDIMGAAIVLILYFVSKIYLHKQRELDSLSSFAWILFFSYLIIRTVFSDDIGYSIYACLRYFDAFLLFYIFYCYSNYETAKKYLTGFLTFSVFSLISAFIATENLKTYKTLLPTNLLYPTYGHNNVVNIILLAFAASVCLWLATQKRRYLLLIILFVVGTLFSFSRAGIALEAFFVAAAFPLVVRKNNNISKKLIMLITILITISVALLALPYVKNNFQISILSSFYKKPSIVASRENYWRQAIAAIADRPLFGAGPGTFTLLSRRYESSYNTNSLFAHSILLEQISELGISGFLLFLIVFFIISIKIIFNRKEIIKHSQHVATLSVVIMCLIYGMIDVPLNFLVVWLLFWATLGVLTGQNSRLFKSNIFTKILVIGTITGLCSVYIYSMINFIYKPLDILNSDYANDLLKGDKNTRYVNMAIALHKNNPDVNFGLAKEATLSGHSEQAIYYAKNAINLYPTEVKYYNLYTSLLLKKGAISDLIKFIQLISIQTLTHDQYLIFTKIDLNQPRLVSKYRREMFIRNSHISNTEYLSVLYYLIGLELVNDKPELTEKLWILARDESPQWGQFHIELAALEEYVLNNKKQSEQILLDCQKNIAPKEECVGGISERLPQPGSLKNRIGKIPEK